MKAASRPKADGPLLKGKSQEADVRSAHLVGCQVPKRGRLRPSKGSLRARQRSPDYAARNAIRWQSHSTTPQPPGSGTHNDLRRPRGGVVCREGPSPESEILFRRSCAAGTEPIARWRLRCSIVRKRTSCTKAERWSELEGVADRSRAWRKRLLERGSSVRQLDRWFTNCRMVDKFPKKPIVLVSAGLSGKCGEQNLSMGLPQRFDRRSVEDSRGHAR